METLTKENARDGMTIHRQIDHDLHTYRLHFCETDGWYAAAITESAGFCLCDEEFGEYEIVLNPSQPPAPATGPSAPQTAPEYCPETPYEKCAGIVHRIGEIVDDWRKSHGG